jgi:glycosyltransferase involved in cell wall biosynthesis
VIGRLLRSLTDGADPADLEIIVVCNGCSDSTVEIARHFGEPVRVIETAVASKASALRLGDRVASGFPRFYVDADVDLSFQSLRRVDEVLEGERWLAAAPRMCVDLSASPWLVRAYYKIWLRLPYHRRGMIGSGVYALSERGRARFDEFPEIISDDGFAQLHFSPDERVTVESASFTIRPPSNLRGVVHVKTRSQKGLVQLYQNFPELFDNDPRDYSLPLLEILADPRLWPASFVYLCVILWTKARAYWMNYTGNLENWERDESSRAGAEKGRHRDR